MRVLVDTHVYFWWVTDDSELSGAAPSVIIYAPPQPNLRQEHGGRWLVRPAPSGMLRGRRMHWRRQTSSEPSHREIRATTEHASSHGAGPMV